jgi:protease PrsW
MAARPARPLLDARRTGRPPAAFLALLTACCLIAVAELVTFVRGGPVPALIGLFLATAPAPLALVVILYLDRLGPEPKGLLAAMFGTGAGIAAITAVAGRALHTGVITSPELEPHAGRTAAVTLSAAVGGALVAETLKAAVMVALLSTRRADVDRAHDGVVFASMLGLGSALIANVYAYAQAERQGVGVLVATFVRRGLFGPLWEPLTAMIGLGVAYAASRPGSGRYWAIVVGWLAAVVLDTLWNDTVTASPGRLAVTYLVLVVALVVVVILVVADRRRLVGMVRQFLPEYADPAVVTAADVRMLASLQLRRLGRQWARLHLGLDGMRAMAEYQLAATELATACNRNRLGRMPADAFVRQRDRSLELMRAAAQAVSGGRPRIRPPWISPSDRSVFFPAR